MPSQRFVHKALFHCYIQVPEQMDAPAPGLIHQTFIGIDRSAECISSQGEVYKTFYLFRWQVSPAMYPVQLTIPNQNLTEMTANVMCISQGWVYENIKNL